MYRNRETILVMAIQLSVGEHHHHVYTGPGSLQVNLISVRQNISLYEIFHVPDQARYGVSGMKYEETLLMAADQGPQ